MLYDIQLQTWQKILKIFGLATFKKISFKIPRIFTYIKSYFLRITKIPLRSRNITVLRNM